MAKFGPCKAIFWPKLTGLRVFGLSALAEGPMDSRSCVRPFVRLFVRSGRDIWRSAHQILMIFCTKLHLDESKKMFQAGF